MPQMFPLPFLTLFSLYIMIFVLCLIRGFWVKICFSQEIAGANDKGFMSYFKQNW